MSSTAVLRLHTLFARHPLGHSKRPHLVPYSLLIPDFLSFVLHLLHVLFPLLFIDLLLQCFLHIGLVILPLMDQYLLLVSTLRKNIAVPLKL